MEFKGKIGKTIDDSTPWWPEDMYKAPDKPNVVMIVLDDVGFAQLGCYGSDIDTPHMDRLATDGLRYSHFTTTALCSPTRACLLTGRNHHSVGVGRVMNFPSGYPGYDAMLKPSAGTLAEILGEHGYGRYAVGKWHLTPALEMSAAGPFDRWPLGKGFERYYGFIDGETNQFNPHLTYDNHFVEQPKSAEEGYHFSEDMIDKAIQFVTDLKNVHPERPFFLYSSFGACHAPHHAPKAYLGKYRGKFDAGWDKWREEALARQKAMGLVPDHVELPPRNEGVKAWDDCTENEKRLFCRFQEAFAAMMDHTDAQIGRLLDHLDSIGVYDDTIFILVSDNGASQEGGPNGTINEFSFFNFTFPTIEESLEYIDDIGTPHAHNNYPWGWAMAGNTPLKRYKQNTHYGGIRDPFILSWKNGIVARGEIRHQFHHATDVVPTLLDVLDLEAPATIRGVEQQPIEGVSMAYSFAEADAPTQKEVQYFEMMGHRGIWKDGWKAVTYHQPDSNQNFDQDKWELYLVDHDMAENHDLAAEKPEKLQELIDAWWVEAEKYKVLPLDDRLMGRMFEKQPTLRTDTRHYIYYPSETLVPENLAVSTRRRSHVISAEVTVPDNANGVILSLGGEHGGWAFYMLDGKLAYTENMLGIYRTDLLSDEVVPAGQHTLSFVFERSKPHNGTGYFYVNDQKIGEGFIAKRTPNAYSISEGLMCGHSGHTPISHTYQCPFPFTGVIDKVTVNAEKTAVDDFKTQFDIAMAIQ